MTNRLNDHIQAVLYQDDYGDEVVVYNDNFGTFKDQPDFTEGKRMAFISQQTDVFSGLNKAIKQKDFYLNEHGKMCNFANWQR